MGATRRGLPESNVFPFAEGNLDALCQQVTENLKTVIEAEVSRFQSRSVQEQGKEAHQVFARDRCKHFLGRQGVRVAIDEYLNSNDARPLVVRGPSGSGKSAIIASASEDHEGIRRFIGGTPEASDGLTLLRSLCEEIGERYGQAGALPATFNELRVTFQNGLRLATSGRPLILYIDALDQLDPQDPAAPMNWLPRKLPPHCRVLFSTIDARQYLFACLYLSALDNGLIQRAALRFIVLSVIAGQRRTTARATYREIVLGLCATGGTQFASLDLLIRGELERIGPRLSGWVADQEPVDVRELARGQEIWQALSGDSVTAVRVEGLEGAHGCGTTAVVLMATLWGIWRLYVQIR